MINGQKLDIFLAQNSKLFSFEQLESPQKRFFSDSVWNTTDVTAVLFLMVDEHEMFTLSTKT